MYQGALTIIIFLVIFEGIALKLEKVGLQSISILTTRYNRREKTVSIHCLNKVLNNKTGPLFLELK